MTRTKVVCQRLLLLLLLVLCPTLIALSVVYNDDKTLSLILLILGIISAVLLIILSIVFLFTSIKIPEQENRLEVLRDYYQFWREIVTTYVNQNGLIDYNKLYSEYNSTNFDKWLGILQNYGPNTLKKTNIELYNEYFKTKEQELQYYINAYNTFAIYGVLYHSFISQKNNGKLIESVMKLNNDYLLFGLNFQSGIIFFYNTKFNLDGEYINLYNLENKIIRPIFKDARIHCAINCCSISCPKLHNDIITIPDLDDLCQNWINNPHNIKLDDKNSTIWLSKIFKFYTNDFIEFYKPSMENGLNELGFVHYYANNNDFKESIKNASINGYTIEYFEYNWQLNHINSKLSLL